MKIFLATDHAGFNLKESIKEYLIDNKYTIQDCGAYSYKEDDDYPDYVLKLAKEIKENRNSIGIVFGKSGAGEAIVANKINGIRAVVGFNKENVRLAKEHNNANVLSLGSDFVDQKKAKQLIEAFLNTSFSNNERHLRRIGKITKAESEN